MIRETSADPDVRRYLHERAAPSGADYLEEVLAVTARTPQRRWWSSLERWLPMEIATRPVVGPLPWRPVVALLALLLALAALAVVYVGSRPRLPEPFGLAANGALAFWRDGDIWLADPDGYYWRVTE